MNLWYVRNVESGCALGWFHRHFPLVMNSPLTLILTARSRDL